MPGFGRGSRRTLGLGFPSMKPGGIVQEIHCSEKRRARIEDWLRQTCKI